MKVDFLSKANLCQYTSELRFGIIDPKPACIDEDTAHESQWIAKVNNPSGYTVKFLPVDQAMKIESTKGQQESTCEGILFYPHPDHNAIIFIELKEVRKGTSGAVSQLENTILLFAANHDLHAYKKRCAFAVNRKHPHFNYSRKTQCQEFWNKYRVRLYPQAEINL